MSLKKCKLVVCAVLVLGLIAIPSAQADTASAAVTWAQAQIGTNTYYGLCLQFVHDAYLNGGGVEIGSAPNAVGYWNGHATAQHPGDANPPKGALVFWNATTSTYANPDGHVAISQGDGSVVSSYERSTITIHTFLIADRNAAGYPYLGWMMPPGVLPPPAGTPPPSAPNGALADIYAVVRNDVSSNHTAAHVINGANWGQYFQNTATGLPMTGSNWSFDWGDLNRDGKLDLWAFNRNPGGSNTVVHVLNGANWGQWLQAGNIVLPATDANWSFKLADFNRDGVSDIYAINRAPGWGHTVVHVINGANWGQYLQAGNIVLPSTDVNWDFDVADFNRDGVPDIWGFNRAPGYPHTVVHVINGANWGQWLQAGNIGLPATDSNWSFAVGDWNGDGTPDIFGFNRNPGGGHTVVHVINGANWGLWWQAGNIVLPATNSSWDFAVGDFK